MITRPISRSISRSIALAINDPNSAGFDPLSLFAAGEQGVWYDPSDFSTLFQDAAGTIPVTAAGQPVGLMRDKSGRGNHATQATATSRPILQTESGRWYLAFDGVDDGMATAAINLTTTDKTTVWVGIHKPSDVTSGVAVEFTASSSSNDGSFSIIAPGAAGVGNYTFRTRGTTTVVSSNQAGYAAPITNVISLRFNNAGTGGGEGASVSPRINGVLLTGTSAVSPGNYANAPLYIGRRGGTTAPFTGRIYSLIVRGAASTTQQITDTENYVNSKTGAY